MTVTAVRPPRVGQVRARLRRRRRGHHSRSFGDVLTDLYILVFFFALYGWAFLDASRGFLRSPLIGHGDPAEQRWLVIAAVLTAAGMGWAGLRALGPVFVGPALQAWVASAPIDRRSLLLPRLVAVLAAATSAVAVLGLGLAALDAAVGGGADAAALDRGAAEVAATGGGGADGAALGRAAADAAAAGAAAFGGAALLGASVGLAAGAAAVVVQGVRRGRRLADLPGRVLLGAGAALAAAVIGAHFADVGLVRPGFTLPAVVPVVALAGAVVAIGFAVRALGRVDRAVMSTGAQFAGSAAGAVVMLDPTLIADLLESRRWRSVGRVRSRRFRAAASWWPGGPGWWPLVQADLRRIGRRRSALLSWAALVLVQYAVALALPGLGGAAHIVTAYLAGARFSGGLRAISRSPGLRRALGGSDTLLTAAHMVVPALAAVLFWLVTVPVGGDRPAHLHGLLMAGVVVAIYRLGTRPPLVYDGPVVETPFGLVQVDLIRQLVRGWLVVGVLVIADLLLT